MRDMTNTYPYTLDVERKSEGVWHWAIRQHGKLVERSDFRLPSEAKARARGMEKIEQMLHGVDDRQH